MKIIMPMAGRGSRFEGTDQPLPKPLIPVAGRPMFAWALTSVDDLPSSRLVFVAQRGHADRFGLLKVFEEHVDRKYDVVLLDGVTEGQLCTVLAARDWFSGHEDLLIISSDTYVVSRLGRDIALRPDHCRGIISTFNLPGERWSFARTDESGRVLEVAEKVRISDHASTGMYYFSDGGEFLAEADNMVRHQEKTRGEYYVMPVYRKYLERGSLVTISQATEMWDLGTPEAKASFERHIASQLP